MLRPFDKWTSKIESFDEECRQLKAIATEDDRKAIAGELREILSAAITEWSDSGYPEQPSTELVMRELVLALFRRGFVRRPPPSHIDEF